MFRKQESQDFFYHVCLSDVETIVISSSPEEAASLGVEKIISEYGNETNVSAAVIVTKFKEDFDSCELYSLPDVLENMGNFTLAKKISTVLKNLLDK